MSSFFSFSLSSVLLCVLFSRFSDDIFCPLFEMRDENFFMRRERDEKRKKEEFWCIFLKKANGRESVVDDDFDVIKSMTTTKTE